MLVMPRGHEAYLSELASLQGRGALTEVAMRELSAKYGVSISGGCFFGRPMRLNEARQRESAGRHRLFRGGCFGYCACN